MREIYEYVGDVTFTASMPLICVLDGAPSLSRAFKDVFKSIQHKVIILDIIHVLEYIWDVAHTLVDGDQAAKKKYVYDKLLLILQGGVKIYIEELEKELDQQGRSEKDKETIQTSLTYFKNHQS